jgi:hypothetical protein
MQQYVLNFCVVIENTQKKWIVGCSTPSPFFYDCLKQNSGFGRAALLACGLAAGALRHRPL